MRGAVPLRRVHVRLRLEELLEGGSVAPLSDLELASRLSYFIWSGPPDEELLALAKAGKLREGKILGEQVRRMVRDPKVSRFAQEFFGHILRGHTDAGPLVELELCRLRRRLSAAS